MTEEEVNHDQAASKYKYSFDFIQKKLEGKRILYDDFIMSIRKNFKIKE